MSSQPVRSGVRGIVSGDERWREEGAEHLNNLVRESQWVLVEFWAPDCIFSRLMKPIRGCLEKRYSDDFLMLRCRVEWEDAHLDEAWGVSALPALVLFHQGKRVARWISSTDSCLIMAQVDALFANSVGESS